MKLLLVHGVIAGLAFTGLAKAEIVPLAAHRAVYDLKMIRSSGAKALADAHTVIAVDFSGSACEGYAMSFRQVMELTPVEGPARASEMRSLTFEDGEGRNFRFKVESTLDGSAGDDLDGRAIRALDGAVSVKLDRPEPKKSDLSDKAIFPTDHIRQILAAAKLGEQTLAVKVFDGSDSGIKIFDTLSVIGKPLSTKPSEPAAQLPELANVARWPVTVSYFTQGKSEDTPDYTLSFDLYENGISRALKLDYGEFVLAGEMSKLELLPVAAACKTAN